MLLMAWFSLISLLWCLCHGIWSYCQFLVNCRYIAAMSSSKVALVTGGNKGIGFAIVRAMCKDFAGDVYMTARDVGRGTAAVDSLRKEGLAPLFHRLDITDPDSVRSARDFFTEKYGGLDVLVNNAGIAFKSKSFIRELTLRSSSFRGHTYDPRPSK